MPEKLWKQTQRKVAKFLGGEVVANIGKKGVDVKTDWLAIEVKARKRLPEWLKDALAFARAHAGEGKLGIVVLHEMSSRDDLVVLSIHDFRQWFGELHRKVGG